MNNYFKKEYTYIRNKKYRDNLDIILNLLPEYFFKVAASSTGKYHPSFSLGEGGLIRHTKVAVKIAYDLFLDDSITNIFTQDEKDMMIFALILHDGQKHGINEEKYTVFDHPLQISKFIKENSDKLTLDINEINFICSVIESHMGPWNTNQYSNVVLPIPKNKYQKFVHMCDYLASRKYLDVKFENDEIIE